MIVESIEAMAKRLGHDGFDFDVVRSALARLPIVLDGYGSIAAPLGQMLAQLGARRFSLIDPKSYGNGSVHSQCEPCEVGRLKVEVGAERLRALGAEVTTYARDLYAVPDGAIENSSIVIATLDNRRADIGSNRRAARMGARLIKSNVEPAADMAAVRAFDFRRGTELCVECQFGEKQYREQRHPNSCDGAADGRPTNSPRWLSRAAALMAAIAVVDMAVDESAASQWIAHERQVCPKSGAVSTSQLTPKPDCKWDHDRRWQGAPRLNEVATSNTLGDLFRQAETDVDVRAQIRFCQQVALGGRCRNCHRSHPTVRWMTDPNAVLADCQFCGGPVYTVGFWTFTQTSVEPLLAVLDRPLADWGVERGAVIELSHNDRQRAFVIGTAQGDAP